MGRFFGTRWRMALCALASGAAIASPVLAQKSRDTLRVALVDPVFTAVLYDDPKPETGLLSSAVFDSLLCFDERNGQIKPQLATAWKMVDDKTLELTLKEGVKFHDGSDLTADDAVYTLNWLVDPKSKYRFAANFAWMDRAEKIDTYRLRVIAKHPTPMLPLRLAFGGHVLPHKLHASYADAGDFGRKTPVGTGPCMV